MLKIRLARFGRKNLPSYKIVVTEAKTKRDSNNIEVIGNYSPINKTSFINASRFIYWLSVGAKPTPTVKSLVFKYAIDECLKEVENIPHKEKIIKSYLTKKVWKT